MQLTMRAITQGRGRGTGVVNLVRYVATTMPNQRLRRPRPVHAADSRSIEPLPHVGLRGRRGGEEDEHF